MCIYLILLPSLCDNISSTSPHDWWSCWVHGWFHAAPTSRHQMAAWPHCVNSALHCCLCDSVHPSSMGIQTRPWRAHAVGVTNLWCPSAKLTLTWCKRRESITQWWIDYSHASFWKPIFLCELNLKLNLLLLSSFLPDRWMEPVKRSWFESVTGGIRGWRSIYCQTFGYAGNENQNCNLCSNSLSYG